MRVVGTVAGSALAALALTACAPGNGGGTAGPVPSAGVADVLTVQDFAFVGGGLTVRPGATVTVVNKDDSAHDVVRKAAAGTVGAWDTGHVGKDHTATFVAPTTPGSYDFHCGIHNYMTGTLTVTVERPSVPDTGPMRRLLLVPAVLLAAGSIAACGGGDATQGTVKSGYDLTIAGYDFAPKPLTVRPGQVVKVDNADQAVHDISSATAGLFDTTALTQNASATFTAPTTAGTYQFGCSFHPDMHGTLIVS